MSMADSPFRQGAAPLYHAFFAPQNALSAEPHGVVPLGSAFGEACLAEGAFEIRKLMKIETLRRSRLEAHEVFPNRERHRRQPAGLENPVHFFEDLARIGNHVRRGD